MPELLKPEVSGGDFTHLNLSWVIKLSVAEQRDMSVVVWNRSHNLQLETVKSKEGERKEWQLCLFSLKWEGRWKASVTNVNCESICVIYGHLLSLGPYMCGQWMSLCHTAGKSSGPILSWNRCTCTPFPFYWLDILLLPPFNKPYRTTFLHLDQVYHTCFTLSTIWYQEVIPFQLWPLCYTDRAHWGLIHHLIQGACSFSLCGADDSSLMETIIRSLI